MYTDVSLGAGVGRRFRVGAPVDVSLVPSVVACTWSTTEPRRGGASSEGTAVALRFDASTRLADTGRAGWALTLTMEAGLAPSMLTNPSGLHLPAGVPRRRAAARPPSRRRGGVRVGASGALL